MIPTPARVGMTEVARLAGVSQKTVSRVVNGEQYVSEAVRERVLAVIAEVGFRPNAAARALVTRRTRRLGVVAVASAQHGPAATIAGVERAAAERGYYVSVARVREETASGLQAAVDELLAQEIEAIAISEATDIGHPDIRVPAGMPILSFDMPDRSQRPSELLVAGDEVSAARRVIEHLLGLGHRTVHHLAGPPGWTASRRREAGWRSALEAAGRPIPAAAGGDWSPASGHDAMVALLADRPTAVFAANDHMAIGAIRAIERAGLRVPDDVSIVGFDDIPESEYLSTALTTVRQDFEGRTAFAISLLIDAVEGRPPSDAVHVVPTELVVRESTAPPATPR